MMPAFSVKSHMWTERVKSHWAGRSTISLGEIAILRFGCNPTKTSLRAHMPMEPAPDLTGAADDQHAGLEITGGGRTSQASQITLPN
jgi:hypothetical protein